MSRQIWMWPRPIRSIEPWKVAALVRAFDLAFGDSIYADQDSQNLFTRIIKDQGLVRPGNTRDINTGGARTYYSLLEALGLVFRAGKYVKLTLAGDELLNPYSEPSEVLQKLILRVQFPSPYSNSAAVKIDSSIRIKPFVFLLKLINDPELGYLTDHEIQIPVIFGHSSNSHKLCREKILLLRAGHSIETLIDSAEILWTSRTAGQTISERMPSILDIANTVRNVLSSAGLITGDGSKRSKFFINNEYEALICEAIEHSEDFIPITNEESFQRKFGTIHRQKDTRNLSLAPPRDPQKDIILALWQGEVGTKPITQIPLEFIKRLETGYRISKQKTLSVIEPLLPQALSSFETTMLAFACGGASTALNFEKAVIELLRHMTQLDVVGTGQKKRPDGGYSDGIIINNHLSVCGLFDCKATSLYSFPSDDRLKATGNYILNYRELTSKEMRLAFFMYVVGGFTQNPASGHSLLADKSPVAITGISVKSLLKMAKTMSPAEVWDTLCSGQIIR
jgi:hypothetical protein